MSTQTATVQTDCPTCFRFHDPAVTACKPAPATVVLPFTKKRVPEVAATVTVKPTGSMLTSDGVAFTATLLRDGKPFGSLENGGNGGGTWFRGVDRAANEFWRDLVEEYGAMDAEHRFLAEEGLADDLYEEAALPKEMNRKRNACFRPVGDDLQYFTFKGVKPGEVPDATWAKVVAQQGPVEQWVKHKGWTLVEVGA